MHKKKFILFSLIVFSFLSVILFLIIFLIKTPSHTRDWESGFEIFPEIVITENIVQVKNIRDWTYNEEGPITYDYKEESFDSTKIKEVYFLLEPFSKWEGIAHTFLLFVFENDKSIVVSVEARREKGEEFNAFYGLFNNFDLINIWGTERDLIGRRLIVEKAKIYKYKMKLSDASAKNLFMQFAIDTIELSKNPEFYNTLTDNCTNRLAYSANRVKPGVIPFDIAWIFPGYSDEFLYKINLLDIEESDIGNDTQLIKKSDIEYE